MMECPPLRIGSPRQRCKPKFPIKLPRLAEARTERLRWRAFALPGFFFERWRHFLIRSGGRSVACFGKINRSVHAPDVVVVFVALHKLDWFRKIQVTPRRFGE